MLETEHGTSRKPDGIEKVKNEVQKNREKASLMDTEIKIPDLKLEVMSRRSMRIICLAFLFILALSIFGVVTLLMILEDSYCTSGNTGAQISLLIVNGCAFIAGGLILLWLLITYPQRIIVRAVRMKWKPLPQQVILVVLILVFNVVPLFSVYRVVLYWVGLVDGIRYQNLPGSNCTLSYMRALPVWQRVDSTTASANLGMSVIYLMWATSMNLVGVQTKAILRRKRAEKALAEKRRKRARIHVPWQGEESMHHPGHEGDELEHVEQDVGDGKGEEGMEEAIEEEELDDSEVMLDELHDDQTGGSSEMETKEEEQKPLVHEEGGAKDASEYWLNHCWRGLGESVKRGFFRARRVRTSGMVMFDCFARLCGKKREKKMTMNLDGVVKKDMTSFELFRQGVTWTLLLLLLVNIGVIFAVEQSLDFRYSVVPFVAIITVTRVCLEKDEYGNSFCSYTVYNTSFQRAMWICGIVVLEVVVFVWILVISRRAYIQLAKVPYNQNRANYISFLFFQFWTTLLWTFIGLFSVIVIFLPDTSAYIYNFRFNTTSDTTYVELDPLYAVGISPFNPGFSYVYASIMLWMATIAFAFLPADSAGIQGWFCGSQEGLKRAIPDARAQFEHNLMARDGQLEPVFADVATVLGDFLVDHPLYLAKEESFGRLFSRWDMTKRKMKERSSSRLASRRGESKLSHRAQTLTKEYSMLNLIVQDYQREVPQIFNQLQSPVLVLETEILLFNFAQLTYMIQSKKKTKSTTKTDSESLSREEQAEDWDEKHDSNKINKACTAKEEADSSYDIFGEYRDNSHQKSGGRKEQDDENENEEQPEEQDPASMIEDERFQFVEHVVDEETDTHAIIAFSEDRVIVAFRGTVSGVNVKTDLTLAMKEYPLAQSIPPLEKENMIEQRAAEKPAACHAGFLKAYRNVAQRIEDLVFPLLFDGLHQRRALFSTGHSLGGGLAVICGFELGAKIYLRHGQAGKIQVTTFGCPRVGSYSFIERFNRVVPRARRFVLSGDLIPRTPPRTFNGPFSGYFHAGTEVLLDLYGNLLINPNFIESVVLGRKLKPPIQRMHFLSRYCLALLLWVRRRHDSRWDAPIWLAVLHRMIMFSMTDINASQKAFVDTIHDIFLREGVVFKNKRTTSSQTDPIQPSPKDKEDQTLYELENQGRHIQPENLDQPAQSVGDEYDSLLAEANKAYETSILSEENFRLLKDLLKNKGK